MNFTCPVFLIRANLVFVGIRYKHLGYNASKASPFYTTEPNSLRAAHPAASTERSHSYPIPDISTAINYDVILEFLKWWDMNALLKQASFEVRNHIVIRSGAGW